MKSSSINKLPQILKNGFILGSFTCLNGELNPIFSALRDCAELGPAVGCEDVESDVKGL